MKIKSCMSVFSLAGCQCQDALHIPRLPDIVNNGHKTIKTPIFAKKFSVSYITRDIVLTQKIIILIRSRDMPCNVYRDAKK